MKTLLSIEVLLQELMNILFLGNNMVVIGNKLLTYPVGTEMVKSITEQVDSQLDGQPFKESVILTGFLEVKDYIPNALDQLKTPLQKFSDDMDVIFNSIHTINEAFVSSPNTVPCMFPVFEIMREALLTAINKHAPYEEKDIHYDFYAAATFNFFDVVCGPSVAFEAYEMFFQKFYPIAWEEGLYNYIDRLFGMMPADQREEIEDPIAWGGGLDNFIDRLFGMVPADQREEIEVDPIDIEMLEELRRSELIGKYLDFTATLEEIKSIRFLPDNKVIIGKKVLTYADPEWILGWIQGDVEFRDSDDEIHLGYFTEEEEEYTPSTACEPKSLEEYFDDALREFVSKGYNCCGRGYRSPLDDAECVAAEFWPMEHSIIRAYLDSETKDKEDVYGKALPNASDGSIFFTLRSDEEAEKLFRKLFDAVFPHLKERYLKGEFDRW